MGPKHTILFGCRKAGVKRHNFSLSARKVPSAKLVRRFPDIALCRQKDEHIARAKRTQLLNSIGDTAHGLDFFAILFADQRPIKNLDGKRAARYLDDRRWPVITPKMLGKPCRIDGCAGDDYF